MGVLHSMGSCAKEDAGGNIHMLQEIKLNSTINKAPILGVLKDGVAMDD